MTATATYTSPSARILQAVTAGGQPIHGQHDYRVGTVLLHSSEFAHLPPGTLLVDAWGAAYRIGWRFMNTAARTVSRYNTAGQGHPEVYDLDEAPPITEEAQLRIVHLGR